MKKICFFGIYSPDYSRNLTMKKAFLENGFQIIECQVSPREHATIGKYILLAKKAWHLRKENLSYIYVAFPGQSVVWLAKLIFKQKVLFDAFLSLYDSNVCDRKIYSKWHPRAFYDWVLDWSSCFLADVVILDTEEHKKYFIDHYFVPANKLIRVLVGAVEDVFYKREDEFSNKSSFLVHFHGTFIPLQGIEYIIDAAKILESESVTFQIVGKGQEFDRIRNKIEKLNLKNINLIGKVPLELLPKYIVSSDICLGIFGNTEKSKRVIPNKIYEYVAMGKTVITAETPAIKEVFVDGYNMLFCKSSSGVAIAEAIKYLKSNPEIIQKLGNSALSFFDLNLRAKKLGEELVYQLKHKNN